MEIIWDTGLTYLTNNNVTVLFRSFIGRIVAFHIPSSKKYIQIKVSISLDFAVPAFSMSKLIGEDINVFVPRSNDNFYNLLDYLQHEEMYLRRKCWEPMSICSSNDSSSDFSLSSSDSSDDGYPSDIFVSETGHEITFILYQQKLAQVRSFIIPCSRNFIHLYISVVWELYDVILYKNDDNFSEILDFFISESQKHHKPSHGL